MPVEKIKITRKELEDMYDIEEVKEDNSHQEDNSNATISFEEFTTKKDKEEKQWSDE